jgi:hypothetical protein
MPSRTKRKCPYCEKHADGSNRNMDDSAHSTASKCPLKKRDDFEIYLHIWYRLASSHHPNCPLTAQNLPKHYNDPQWADLYQRLLSFAPPLKEDESKMIKSALPGGITRREYLYTRQPPALRPSVAAPAARHRPIGAQHSLSPSTLTKRTYERRQLVEAIEEYGTSSSDDEVDDIEDFAEAAAPPASHSFIQGTSNPKASRPTRFLSKEPEPAASVNVKDTPPKKAVRVSFASSVLSNGPEVPAAEDRRSVSPRPSKLTRKLYVPESPLLEEDEKCRSPSPAPVAVVPTRRRSRSRAQR